MKYKLLLYFFFIGFICLRAQTVYPVLNVAVTKNTFTFRQPWCGGLNSPQLTQGDLNGDGINDLFAFDRAGDKPLVFLNNGTNSDTAFDYYPQYDKLIPEVFQHAQLRDYNFDSVPDLFAWTATGTKLYKGVRNGNTVQFQLVNSLLLRQDAPYYTNMFSLADDFCPFVDVNGDGDLDFLTFGLGASMEYYENQTVELSLPYDSIRFASAVTCWGHFAEDALVSAIHLIACKNDEGMAEESAEGSRHAGGSTIYAFDKDHDNDMDLILGDFGWEQLFYLENCGTNTSASVCYVDSTFPKCDTPNDGIIYPAAFGVDANNDNLTDILVAPNPRAGTADVRNINYYRHTADTACPYEFVSDTFLVSEMLDFGTDSKPTLFDYNSDGLLDLVVGNYGYFRPFTTYLSELALLENTGTNSLPKYNLRNLNYSNLAQFNLIAVHPAFGDLDSDGYKDLLVGDLNGNVHFFKSPPAVTVAFNNMTTPMFMSIDVGQYAAPFIYDINNDGLNDILCGKKDGKLTYLWNYGTTTSPQFSMDSANTSFGGINVTLSGSSEGHSQPSIITDASGNKILYVGSNRGVVFKYQIDTTKLRSGIFNLISNDALQFDVGIKSAVAVADLNSDGKTDYITGNSRGGLNFFSEAILDSSVLISVEEVKSDNEFQFSVFPNPASSQITIRFNKSASITLPTVSIHDLLGRNFPVEVTSTGAGEYSINTQYLQSGLYVLILNNNFKTARKIFIQH